MVIVDYNLNPWTHCCKLKICRRPWPSVPVSKIKILLDMAQAKNFKVVAASRGETGLAYARRYKPDVITLDIQLPGIHGLAVLEERTPTYIADWSVKDRPRARELLESLRGKK